MSNLSKTDQDIYFIPKLKCVSQDVLSYGYLNGFWHFTTSKCIFVDVTGEKMKICNEKVNFLFISSKFVGNLTRFKEGNLVFAIYDYKHKVSNSKKYKVNITNGGFLSLGEEQTYFQNGLFEFNFLVEGPETNYKKPLEWTYSSKSSPHCLDLIQKSFPSTSFS